MLGATYQCQSCSFTWEHKDWRDHNLYCPRCGSPKKLLIAEPKPRPDPRPDYY